MKPVRFAGIIVLQCALFATAALAEALVTDRPDATESSSVIPPGYVQIEAGWLVSDRDGANVHELPQTLIRAGIINQVELRLGWTGYIASDPSSAGEGVGDGELGTKIYLWEERGACPEAALLAGVSLPWGGSEVSSKEVDPGFRFAFSHTLTDRLSLGYNLGVKWATEEGSTLSSIVYTTALGFGLTDSLAVFVEFFGDAGLSASGEAHSFDGGFTYLVRENLQFDVFGGIGLSDQADDWFAGAGLSYRFPN